MNKLSLILLFGILSLGLFAQTGSGSQDKKSTSVESQVILSLAKSTARSSQEQAIDLLEEKSSDDIGGNANLMEALRYLTNYSFSLIVRDNNKGMEINYSDIRRRAVKVLAGVGTDEAKKVISTILSYDKNVTVLAEAAYALGDLGDPSDDMTVEILMRSIIYSKSLDNVDNNLMYSALLGLSKLGEKGGFSTSSNKRISEALLDILTISGDNVMGPTRKKALEVIDKLQKK